MEKLGKHSEESYREAYKYLRKHRGEMKYKEYRRRGFPIGSGVTEAGCKVVFTQRFKESGVTWYRAGGEWVLRLRLAVLSEVYEELYGEYLAKRERVQLGTRCTQTQNDTEKTA